MWQIERSHSLSFLLCSVTTVLCRHLSRRREKRVIKILAWLILLLGKENHEILWLWTWLSLPSTNYSYRICLYKAYSYDSTHDFLSSVEIIHFVNKNHSFNSGDDFLTHHKIIRMIKELISNHTMMIWVQIKSQYVVLCVMIHTGRLIITWIITNVSIAWILVLGAMRLLGYLSFHCQHTHVE